MKRVTVIALILTLTRAAASAAAVSVYVCPKVSTPPTIDGKLDDSAWRIAPAVTLVDAVTGKPATKKTIARMCWDIDNLYVCFDSQDTDVWGTLTNRDDKIYLEEVVEVFVSPFCDLKRYFEINVSPRNVVFDFIVYDPVDGHPSPPSSGGWNWDGMRTAVVADGTLDNRSDTDRGWTAEIALPFAGVGRSRPRPGERWRINLYRIDLTPKPTEFQAWSPTYHDPAAFHIPECFGTLFFTDCTINDRR